MTRAYMREFLHKMIPLCSAWLRIKFDRFSPSCLGLFRKNLSVEYFENISPATCDGINVPQVEISLLISMGKGWNSFYEVVAEWVKARNVYLTDLGSIPGGG